MSDTDAADAIDATDASLKVIIRGRYSFVPCSPAQVKNWSSTTANSPSSNSTFRDLTKPRVEAAFSRLKRWRVLECKYRHSLKEHRLVWKVLVALYNIDIVLHPLSA